MQVHIFGSLAQFLMSQKGLGVVREKGLGFHQNPDSIQIHLFLPGSEPLWENVYLHSHLSVTDR